MRFSPAFPPLPVDFYPPLLLGDVIYTVCVKFPSGKNLCAQAQEAEQGTLYVNKITSTIPGRHVVSWYVKGQKVGSWAFRVTG